MGIYLGSVIQIGKYEGSVKYRENCLETLIDYICPGTKKSRNGF